MVTKRSLRIMIAELWNAKRKKISINLSQGSLENLKVIMHKNMRIEAPTIHLSKTKGRSKMTGEQFSTLQIDLDHLCLVKTLKGKETLAL